MHGNPTKSPVATKYLAKKGEWTVWQREGRNARPKSRVAWVRLLINASYDIILSYFFKRWHTIFHMEHNFPHGTQKGVLWLKFIQRTVKQFPRKWKVSWLKPLNKTSQYQRHHPIPNMPSHISYARHSLLNTKYKCWFTLFCGKTIFVTNLRTFWVQIYRPQNAVAYKY